MTREGCRGGRDLFKWNDVRLLPARDRERYLGFSTKLGYLDQGKWQKKDWWQNYNSKVDSKNKNELAKTKEKELSAYKEKLGIIKHTKEDSKDINLNRLKGIDINTKLSKEAKKNRSRSKERHNRNHNHHY